MKAKKLSALLLALLMLISLTACGGTGGSSAGASTPSSVSPSTPDDSTPDSSETSMEPLEFHMATTFMESEPLGILMQYFVDRCSELSDGAITGTIGFGGSEYDMMGCWEALSSGAIQVGFVLSAYTNFVPYINFCASPPAKDIEEAINLTNYILKENPETSQLIKDQFASFNMVPLNNMASSPTSFVTSFEWTTLEELSAKCTSFGTMNSAKYSALGLSCTAATGPDIYDSFSRGIIDGNSSAVANAVSYSLYEVADYITMDNQYACAAMFTANKDWLDSLTDAQRAVIEQAALDAEEYSIAYYSNNTEECDAIWYEKTGNHIASLSDEDTQSWWEITFKNTADNAMTSQAGTANEEGMLTILNTWAEYMGVEWSWEG